MAAFLVAGRVFPPCLAVGTCPLIVIVTIFYCSCARADHVMPLSVLQVEHTRDVMSEVEAVSNQYEALAVSCSQLYFALETLRDVHFLYHFSLRFFQDILAKVP